MDLSSKVENLQNIVMDFFSPSSYIKSAEKEVKAMLSQMIAENYVLLYEYSTFLTGSLYVWETSYNETYEATWMIFKLGSYIPS